MSTTPALIDARMSSPASSAEDFVAARAVAHSRRRERTPLAPAAAGRVLYQNKIVLNFCSNDYLGLANDERVIAAFKNGADRFGVGSGASQLICGYSEAHAELEKKIGDFTGYDRALYFANGYLANLGAITALTDRDTGVHIDRLAHASLIDAVRLSRARFQRYAHNDVANLDARLSTDSSARRLVISEGIFSMEGDRAPLPAIAECCRQRQALLYLDDAHAFGVLGEQGRGSRSEFSLGCNDVPLMMATFGKALGTSGAFVAGSEALIDTILQRARSLIYTTAPPPALAVATITALDIVIAEPWRREKLQSLIRHWRKAASDHDLPLLDSDTPIQPLMIGADENALAASHALREQGILISAIRPPTVPAGQARLRVTLSCAQERADIDALVQALASILHG